MSTSTANTKEISFDLWLAGHFRKDVWRVDAKQGSSEAGLASEIQMLQRKPVFLYTKVATSDLNGAAYFTRLGFHLIDTNVVFEKEIAPTVPLTNDITIGSAEKMDEEAVVALAAKNCTTSRFHLDPAIPRGLANQIKGDWVRNYFLGTRGQDMLLAKWQGQLAGFAQLLQDPQGVVTIDLIATEETLRRKGVASALIAHIQNHSPGFTRLRVGTQISNTASLRLYEKMDLRIVASSYVFHFHA